MTSCEAEDRINLDVATDAIIAGSAPPCVNAERAGRQARAALDAVDVKHRLADRTPAVITHLLDLLDAVPALADLTPDDVQRAFDWFRQTWPVPRAVPEVLSL